MLDELLEDLYEQGLQRILDSEGCNSNIEGLLLGVLGESIEEKTSSDILQEMQTRTDSKYWHCNSHIKELLMALAKEGKWLEDVNLTYDDLAAFYKKGQLICAKMWLDRLQNYKDENYIDSRCEFIEEALFCSGASFSDIGISKSGMKKITNRLLVQTVRKHLANLEQIHKDPKDNFDIFDSVDEFAFLFRALASTNLRWQQIGISTEYLQKLCQRKGMAMLASDAEEQMFESIASGVNIKSAKEALRKENLQEAEKWLDLIKGRSSNEKVIDLLKYVNTHLLAANADLKTIGSSEDELKKYLTQGFQAEASKWLGVMKDRQKGDVEFFSTYEYFFEYFEYLLENLFACNKTFGDIGTSEEEILAIGDVFKSNDK